MQFRSSKLIFVVKRLLKLGNLAQKVPHVAIYNNICSNYSSIQGRKTIQVRKLFTIQGRKLFKGGNYMRKYGIYILLCASWLFFS